MATWQKFNCFVQDMAHKVHNLSSDQLTLALCATANAPVAGNTVLANLTQISYTNLSSRNVTTTSSGQSGGTYSLVLADLTLSASGGAVAAWQYAVLYNSTAAGGPLIAFFDYGSALTLANLESVLIDMPATAFTLGP